MKRLRLFPLLYFSCLLVSCDEKPASVPIYCDAIVLENHWVTVNEDIEQDFANAVHLLKKGEICLIRKGGYLSILHVYQDSAEVWYDAPTNSIGTTCPIGAEFTLPISLLTEWGWKEK